MLLSLFYYLSFYLPLVLVAGFVLLALPPPDGLLALPEPLVPLVPLVPPELVLPGVKPLGFVVVPGFVVGVLWVVEYFPPAVLPEPDALPELDGLLALPEPLVPPELVLPGL